MLPPIDGTIGQWVVLIEYTWFSGGRVKERVQRPFLNIPYTCTNSWQHRCTFHESCHLNHCAAICWRIPSDKISTYNCFPHFQGAPENWVTQKQFFTRMRAQPRKNIPGLQIPLQCSDSGFWNPALNPHSVKAEYCAVITQNSSIILSGIVYIANPGLLSERWGWSRIAIKYSNHTWKFKQMVFAVLCFGENWLTMKQRSRKVGSQVI